MPTDETERSKSQRRDLGNMFHDRARWGPARLQAQMLALCASSRATWGRRKKSPTFTRPLAPSVDGEPDFTQVVGRCMVVAWLGTRKDPCPP